MNDKQINQLDEIVAKCCEIYFDAFPMNPPKGGEAHIMFLEATIRSAVIAGREDLDKKLNSPELISFRDAVVLEAAHQRERWGSEHDAGKEPQDWFWLLGYLAGKALRAHIDGDVDKALHHTISTAAVLNNWHAAILGANCRMRPGIAQEKQRE